MRGKNDIFRSSHIRRCELMPETGIPACGAGRPGPFAKTISVYSNGKKGSFILNIRGEVTE